MNYHSSWPAPAIEKFEACIAAHGGWEAWNRFERIELRLLEFGGFLLSLKGLGRTFQKPDSFLIEPKNRTTEFVYGTHTDRFIDGKLIFSPQKIEVADGRALFSRSTLESWRPEHALYFFGYALANYAGYPFILPGFELLRWRQDGAVSKFTLRFPEEFHTHSRVQTFFFGEDGLLSRHDYRADYAGAFFYGAHLTQNYRRIRDLQFPTFRRVLPRVGERTFPVSALIARLDG